MLVLAPCCWVGVRVVPLSFASVTGKVGCLDLVTVVVVGRGGDGDGGVCVSRWVVFFVARYSAVTAFFVFFCSFFPSPPFFLLFKRATNTTRFLWKIQDCIASCILSNICHCSIFFHEHSQ